MVRISKLNEWVAVRTTLVFGTMWMTYLFFLYGFVPIMFPHEMNTFMYWGNTVQLWSLPLLMVGQNVMGRVSEKRAVETHDAVMAELADLKRLHAFQSEELRELKEINQALHTRLQGWEDDGR